MIKSKHLGKKFGRWTVSRISRERDGHYRFYLTRTTSDGAIKTVGLTNVAMAKLARGETTINTLLKNKQFQKKILLGGCMIIFIMVVIIYPGLI